MTRDDDAAAERQAGAREPVTEDVALQIERASGSVPMAGAAGAALRSMLISVIIVGGAVWLARLLFGRGRARRGDDTNG